MRFVGEKRYVTILITAAKETIGSLPAEALFLVLADVSEHREKSLC